MTVSSSRVSLLLSCPGRSDRSCASPSAPRRTSRSSRARGSTDRAPAPARSSPCGSRTDRARPADTGRRCRRCDRLPSRARRRASTRWGCAAARAAAAGHPAAGRRHPWLRRARSPTSMRAALRLTGVRCFMTPAPERLHHRTAAGTPGCAPPARRRSRGRCASSRESIRSSAGWDGSSIRSACALRDNSRRRRSAAPSTSGNRSCSSM